MLLPSVAKKRTSLALDGIVSGVGSLLLKANSFAQTQLPDAGQETTLEHVAPWPPWVTILILIATAVFTFGLYLRERTEFRTWVKLALATIRFALICLVLWMMYGYTLRPFRTDLPDLLLVVDTSQSMSTVDAATNPELHEQLLAQVIALELPDGSRLNQAKSILLRDEGKLPKFLRDNYQLKLVTLDSAATKGEAELDDFDKVVRQLAPSGDSSTLGTTLRQALQKQRGRPVAAVVYLTDGITTEGPPLSEIAVEAKQRQIPMHVVGLGSQQPPKDLRLSDLLVDDVVFVGDLITFDLTLHGNGFQNEAVEVILKRLSGQSQGSQSQESQSQESQSQGT